jgi:prolyl oligopeptidase
MKRFLVLVLPLLCGAPAHAGWQYPATRVVDASDTYFGTTYKDPYRWLENLKDKEVEGRGSLST